MEIDRLRSKNVVAIYSYLLYLQTYSIIGSIALVHVPKVLLLSEYLSLWCTFAVIAALIVNRFSLYKLKLVCILIAAAIGMPIVAQIIRELIHISMGIIFIGFTAVIIIFSGVLFSMALIIKERIVDIMLGKRIFPIFLGCSIVLFVAGKSLSRTYVERLDALSVNLCQESIARMSSYIVDASISICLVALAMIAILFVAYRMTKGRKHVRIL